MSVATVDTGTIHQPPWKNINWKTSYSLPKERIDLSVEWTIATPDTLRDTKDSIGDYSDNVWEYYKKLTNPYELIFTTQGDIPTPQSICVIKPLSRSYFKMIEMLSVIGFFDMFKGSAIRTAHVCEGPGGFIEATYDMGERMRRRVVGTKTMTLKPTHNHIPGWRRAANFLRKHPEVKIHYGPKGTGDILDAANRAAFIEDTRYVHLFTADGGVDFTTNFPEQEKTIFPLLCASVHIGLSVLCSGGVFILKFFDAFATPTQDLIIGLGSQFKRWTLYKPATSRPCNSEQYFIGLDYKGVSPKFMKIVETAIITQPASLWEELPDAGETVRGELHEQRAPNTIDCKGDTVRGLRAALREDQAVRAGLQVAAITEALAAIRLPADEVIGLWKKNLQVCINYCRTFSIFTSGTAIRRVEDMNISSVPVYVQPTALKVLGDVCFGESLANNDGGVVL